MSASDWVAKTTRGVLLAQRLQPFAELAGKALVVEREPALVDDEQGGPAVEPVLDAMEEIGEHRGRGAGADQAFGLERLNVGLAEPLGLGIEQPALGPAEAIGLQRPLQSVCDCSSTDEAGQRALRRRGRGKRGQRRPEMLLDLRRDDDRFAGQDASRSIRPPRRAPRHRRSGPAAGARPVRWRRPTARRRDRASRRPWRARPRGSSRRSRRRRPELRDSGGTAAPSAPAAPILPAPVGPTTSVWPTSPTCSENRNGVAPSVRAKNSGGASRCSSRSGPAQTADNGIMWARLSVETGGWRTLA